MEKRSIKTLRAGLLVLIASVVGSHLAVVLDRIVGGSTLFTAAGFVCTAGAWLSYLLFTSASFMLREHKGFSRAFHAMLITLVFTALSLFGFMRGSLIGMVVSLVLLFSFFKNTAIGVEVLQGRADASADTIAPPDWYKGFRDAYLIALIANFVLSFLMIAMAEVMENAFAMVIVVAGALLTYAYYRYYVGFMAATDGLTLTPPDSPDEAYRPTA